MTQSIAGSGRSITSYRYTDPEGVLLFKVRRSSTGLEIVGTCGEVLDDIPALVLYRLPDLRAADPDCTVYVAASERDVDLLRELRVVATTNPGGCWSGWRPNYIEELRGRHVIILPAADHAGRCHAARLVHLLERVARSVLTVELPGATDVSDWLAQGNTIADLEEQVTRCRYGKVGLSPPSCAAQKRRVIYCTGLETTERLLLLAMLEHSRPLDSTGQDVVKLSAAELGEFVGAHRVKIQRALAKLCTAGILLRTDQGHAIAWHMLAALVNPDLWSLAAAAVVRPRYQRRRNSLRQAVADDLAGTDAGRLDMPSDGKSTTLDYCGLLR